MSLRDRIAMSMLLALARRLNDKCKEKGGILCVFVGVLFGVAAALGGEAVLDVGGAAEFASVTECRSE